jgi:hypothetical protein
VKLYVIALLGASLAGCATTTSLSFNDQMTTAYALVQTVAQEADLLATSGVISKNDASNISQQASNVKAVLDVATAAHAANASDGGDQLVTALATLNQLNASLIALQAPKQ